VIDKNIESSLQTTDAVLTPSVRKAISPKASPFSKVFLIVNP